MKRVTDKEFWIHEYLRKNLKTITHNLGRDWDFVFVISGDGMVRVGKSVLAQQIAYFVAYEKGTPFSLENIVFSGEELMSVAHRLPKNSCIIYDEARGELDSKKTLEKVSKVLQDFFAECGMYNHFIILVLPDFFELNRNLAISRSEALINVFRTAEAKTDKDGEEVLQYVRGFYDFYNRSGKKKLYDWGKKNNKEYNKKFRKFWGEFRNELVVDKDAYERKKMLFLRRNRLSENKPNKFQQKTQDRLIASLSILNDLTGSQRKMSELFAEKGVDLSQQRISQLLNDDNAVEKESPNDSTITNYKLTHIPIPENESYT